MKSPTKRVFELCRGDTFEFLEADPYLPVGNLSVLTSWGVRFEGRPPQSPWTVACKDAMGEIHLLLLSPDTVVAIK